MGCAEHVTCYKLWGGDEILRDDFSDLAVLETNAFVHVELNTNQPRAAPLIPCGIWESRKSGVRSQNGNLAIESNELINTAGTEFSLAPLRA
jgi:hypothetical protein